ncbi:hypothetical protein MRX96_045368 [Rhipicephalus microplus]
MHRECNESSRADFATSFSNSTEEELRKRPPSRADWYDDCEMQLNEPYETQVFDELKSNNNTVKVASDHHSTKRRERVSRRPKFKEMRAQFLKPSIYHAGNRRCQIVTTGWVEVLSTIFEEPSRETALQEGWRHLSRPTSVSTSMATQTSCSWIEASEWTSNITQTPAVVKSSSSASKRDLFLGTSSSTAMLEKPSVESGSPSASFAMLAFGQNRSSLDSVLTTEGGAESAETSDVVHRLPMCVPALCTCFKKLSIDNLHATLSDSPQTEQRCNSMAEYELTK